MKKLFQNQMIRLRIPDLTEERRKDLIKILKNMGEKNHRERDADSLKVQRLQSVKIVVKAVLSAAILTAIIYSI